MRLTNGTVWVEFADTYGPRVSGYGFEDASSVLGDGTEAQRETPLGTWRSYGGHRLWLAPERFPETYRLDDDAPELRRDGERAASATHRGDAFGFVTTLELQLADEGTGVRVTHRAEHRGTAPRTVAPWGITVMRPGGVAVLPRDPARPHADALEPTATVGLWAYARLDDPRVGWRRDAILVRNDPADTSPWKIGTSGPEGWCAYVAGDVAFVKRFAVVAEANYPDRGCAVETFTAGRYVELETLGPLTALAPGASTAYVETWSLHRLDGADATAAQLRALLG